MLRSLNARARLLPHTIWLIHMFNSWMFGGHKNAVKIAASVAVCIQIEWVAQIRHKTAHTRITHSRTPPELRGVLFHLSYFRFDKWLNSPSECILCHCSNKNSSRAIRPKHHTLPSEFDHVSSEWLIYAQTCEFVDILMTPAGVQAPKNNVYMYDAKTRNETLWYFIDSVLRSD